MTMRTSSASLGAQSEPMRDRISIIGEGTVVVHDLDVVSLSR